MAPVHFLAVRIVLTTLAEVDMQLEAETADALLRQQPLADKLLRIVTQDEKEDGGPPDSASLVGAGVYNQNSGA